MSIKKKNTQNVKENSITTFNSREKHKESTKNDYPLKYPPSVRAEYKGKKIMKTKRKKYKLRGKVIVDPDYIAEENPAKQDSRILNKEKKT